MWIGITSTLPFVGMVSLFIRPVDIRLLTHTPQDSKLPVSLFVMQPKRINEIYIMAIADYESIMLPILKTLINVKEMSLREHFDEMEK